MRIAVDAMGGDFAPGEIVEGTLRAARTFDDVTRLVLVGDRTVLENELARHGDTPDCIDIFHASEVVGMHESPATAIRRKKDSSIGRAVDLVKSGEVDSMFSAGNTGAVVAAATLKLRTLEGVDRPAIATVLPSPAHNFILLDAGANTDCTPHMLGQFAVMGAVYAREILKLPEARVGVLSIGEEEAKGNETTREALRILERSSLNFVGNVESGDLFEGRVDVAVCDGFVGNVVLKTSESVAKAMGQWLKDAFKKNLISKLGALLLLPALKEIKRKSDPESHGGAYLIGANGVCVIGHGSSSAYAVQNGIRVAMEAVQHDVNHLIVDGIKEMDTAL